MSQIRIERIPLGELYEFAKNAERDQKHYHILPITVKRAFSHSNNPVAAPDDIGLIVAYCEDICIGYLGILPCQIMHNGKLSKIYALSTFYVDESFRRKKVAAIIMAEAIKLEQDLLLAGFTRDAKRFYQRNEQWFEETGPLKYLRIHLHPSSSVLWLLKNSSKLMRAVFTAPFSLNRILCNAGNGGFRYRLFRPRGLKTCENVESRPVSQVHALKGDINTLSKVNNSYFFRDHNILNWMIKYPWITEDQGVTLNYLFSYKQELFRFLPFELYSKESGKTLGYVVFSIRDKKELKYMKILDYMLIDDKYEHCVLNLALREATRWRADVIEASHKFLPVIQTHSLLNILTQHVKRGYFLHLTPKNSAFVNHKQELELDVCDGDIPFC